MSLRTCHTRTLVFQFNLMDLSFIHTIYKDLEEKFGLEPGILPQDDDHGEKDEEEGSIKEVTVDPDMDSTEYVLGKGWRDLIPVIKVGWMWLVAVLSVSEHIFNRLIFPLVNSYLVTGCFQQLSWSQWRRRTSPTPPSLPLATWTTSCTLSRPRRRTSRWSWPRAPSMSGSRYLGDGWEKI